MTPIDKCHFLEQWWKQRVWIFQILSKKTCSPMSAFLPLYRHQWSYLMRTLELRGTSLQLLKHLTVLRKHPHIVCHEFLLISFPLLAVAEVVCCTTLIPIGQRALQRGRRRGRLKLKKKKDSKAKSKEGVEEEGRREEWRKGSEGREEGRGW